MERTERHGVQPLVIVAKAHQELVEQLRDVLDGVGPYRVIEDRRGSASLVPSENRDRGRPPLPTGSDLEV